MKFVGKRLLQLIPILLAITFLSFAMMRIAGSDAVEEMYTARGTVVSDEVMQEKREELGLDRSFMVQYGSWLLGILHGDMGKSYVSGKDVFGSFLSKLPATLLLAAFSLGLTVLISIPIGILAAVRQGRLTDKILRASSFLGNAMPGFFVAMVLMQILGLKLKLFPVISTGVNLRSAVLPGLTLSISMTAKYLRQVRAAVLEELNKDYIRGLKARGISNRVILWKNVMRSASLSIITLLALSAGSLLGGTAIIESIFMWDGVGKLAVDAISMRDYPMILAYVMWMAIIFVLVNLATDIIYHFMDPRIRLGEEEEG
ncbi:MAG: ABC transporter permease [Lachnospiraceae bacterium]|nr:ABC transporter permease [Lachnospiraceae bacterium]